MSKNKKNGKKGMSSATKANLKLGASSIINNAACVELGRNKPWYGAVISAVLSVILAVIPIMVSNFSTKGGDSFFGSYTYGFEEGLVHFQDEMTDKNISLYVDTANKTLTVSNWDNLTQKKEDTGYAYDITWYRHINTTTDPNNPYVDFEAYYIADDSNFTTAVNNIVACKTPSGISRLTEYMTPTKDPKAESSESSEESVVSSKAVKREESSTPATSDSAAVSSSEETSESIASSSSSAATSIDYQSNVLILGQSKFTAFKYSRSSTTKSGGYVYLYDRGESFDIAKKFARTDGVSTTDYMSTLKTNWTDFMNLAYETNKITAGWANTGIMSGVFAAFVLFMGLLVFLMTRGKSNPYRIYTFWECQKIAYWAAFTPAVLAMGLGFIPLFKSYTMFLFIFMYGMRLMWLSMKTLRPDVGSEKK